MIYSSIYLETSICFSLFCISFGLFLFTICLDYVQRTSLDLIKENWFTLKYCKKQTLSRTNYYGCRLCRLFSASCKYTRLSLNHTVEARAGINRNWSLRELEWYRLHVFVPHKIASIWTSSYTLVASSHQL